MQISVIIPTYNRSKILSECLGELEGQSFPKEEFEVIVIDDASRDRTYELVGSFGHRLNIRYFRQERNKGPAAARNVGIKEAKGEIIAFLDDDCLPDKDWLANISGIFKSAEAIEIVQGGFKIYPTFNPLRKMYLAITNLAEERRIMRGVAGSRYDHALFLGTGTAAIRKSLLFKNNLFFDEILFTKQDIDLYRRIKAQGLDIIYSDKIKVKHICQSDPVSFFRRYFRYGRGAFLLKNKWLRKEFSDAAGVGKITFKRLSKYYDLTDIFIIYFVLFTRDLIGGLGFRYEKLRYYFKRKAFYDLGNHPHI